MIDNPIIKSLVDKALEIFWGVKQEQKEEFFLIGAVKQAMGDLKIRPDEVVVTLTRSGVKPGWWFNDLKDGAEYKEWNEVYMHIIQVVLEAEIFEKYPAVKEENEKRLPLLD